MSRIMLLATLAVVFAPQTASFMDWVTVGDPSNPPDSQVMDDGTSGYGSVEVVYRIGKYEVTNTQYADFLNAVASSDDPNELYATAMATSSHGGITRKRRPPRGRRSPVRYSYRVKPGFEHKPVVFVSFFDAARFANWLHNGRPSGAQTASTTEDGAYRLLGTNPRSVTRNPGARFFLPSENEWYKAAYYNMSVRTYSDFTTGTDALAACVPPTADTGNSMNCDNAVGNVTDVGSYRLSVSPFGTMDQGGNVFEWTETITGMGRALRGSAWDRVPLFLLRASWRGSGVAKTERDYIGFRLAAAPW